MSRRAKDVLSTYEMMKHSGFGLNTISTVTTCQLIELISSPGNIRELKSFFQRNFSVNQNWQQVETAADWISCSSTGLRRPFCDVRGGHGSFRLRGGQPRGFALLGDRLPSFQRFFSYSAHPRQVIRAGRQKPDVCRCAALKKGHISSSTVSTNNVLQQKKEMQRITKGIARNEARFLQQPTKVEKNKRACAELAAEVRGLQAGEERRGINASQAVDCCLETMVEQMLALGADQAGSKFEAMCQIFFRRIATSSAQMPGKGGRRNSEDEQGQGKTSQQLVLPAPGGFNEGTPASSMDLIFFGREGTSGTAKDLSTSPSRLPMEDDALLGE